MIHQPSGGAQGQVSDIKIHAERIIAIRSKMNEMLAKMTGQPLNVIEMDTERDHFMTAEEAKAYGLIDEILNKQK